MITKAHNVQKKTKHLLLTGTNQIKYHEVPCPMSTRWNSQVKM